MNNIYQSAISFYTNKKYDDAINLLESLPQTPEILFAIATCHKDNGSLKSLLNGKNIFEQLIVRNIKNKILRKDIAINYVSDISFLSKYYVDASDYDRALEVTKNALHFVPNDPICLYNIGHIYKCIGDFDNAIIYLRKSLKYDNSFLGTYIELINIYRDRRDEQQLLKCINDGIKNVKDNTSLYNDLGLYYLYSDRKKSLEFFNTALQLNTEDKPLMSKIYTNIGHLLSTAGNINGALENYENAISVCPTDMIPRQNYIMDILYLDNIDYSTVIKKHLETGFAVHNKYHVQNFVNQHYDNIKIHIGYISGDFFGTHPMTYFIRKLLTCFDNSKFKVHCYSINDIGDTSIYYNEILWRNIKYSSLGWCIKQILTDRIDILIDLSGHTSGNRMDIFSNRLAKVQLSYLGYPCISGMPEIDYHIIDKTFNYNTSKTISMDDCFTHYDVPFIPKNLIQPYHINKCITFCSFNKSSKINDSVVKFWDEILDEFPSAKLIIKNINNFNFKNAERVKTMPFAGDYRDYISQYNLADIALDTFPYAGTTTTCESLLMGTPVITMADRKTNAIHQNTTASILINSNLSNLIATNKNEYIKIIRDIICKIEQCDNYKNIIQTAFLYGNVTNSSLYLKNYESLLLKLHGK